MNPITEKKHQNKKLLQTIFGETFPVDYRFRFGETERLRLKAIRLYLGFNQKEMADLIGIGITALNRYERGWQKPVHKNIQARIQKLFNAEEFSHLNKKYVKGHRDALEIRRTLPMMKV